MSVHSLYHEQITGMITHTEHFHLQYSTEAQELLKSFPSAEGTVRDSPGSGQSTV